MQFFQQRSDETTPIQFQRRSVFVVLYTYLSVKRVVDVVGLCTGRASPRRFYQKVPYPSTFQA